MSAEAAVAEPKVKKEKAPKDKSIVNRTGLRAQYQHKEAHAVLQKAGIIERINDGKRGRKYKIQDGKSLPDQGTFESLGKQHLGAEFDAGKKKAKAAEAAD